MTADLCDTLADTIYSRPGIGVVPTVLAYFVQRRLKQDHLLTAVSLGNFDSLGGYRGPSFWSTCRVDWSRLLYSVVSRNQFLFEVKRSSILLSVPW